MEGVDLEERMKEGLYRKGFSKGMQGRKKVFRRTLKERKRKE